MELYKRKAHQPKANSPRILILYLNTFKNGNCTRNERYFCRCKWYLYLHRFLRLFCPSLVSGWVGENAPSLHPAAWSRTLISLPPAQTRGPFSNRNKVLVHPQNVPKRAAPFPAIIPHRSNFYTYYFPHLLKETGMWKSVTVICAPRFLAPIATVSSFQSRMKAIGGALEFL